MAVERTELNPYATNATPIVIGKFNPKQHTGRYYTLLRAENMLRADVGANYYLHDVDPSTIFVASRVNGPNRLQPVGFAESSGTPRMLRGVVVDNFFRGGVIGKQLVYATIYEAESQMKNREELQIDLPLDNESLHAAISQNGLANFYESLGFVPEYAVLGMKADTSPYLKDPPDIAVSQAFRDIYARTHVHARSSHSYFTDVPSLDRTLRESGLDPTKERKKSQERNSQMPVCNTIWEKPRFEDINRRWVNVANQRQYIRWLKLETAPYTETPYPKQISPEGLYAVYSRDTGAVIPLEIANNGGELVVIQNPETDAAVKTHLLQSAVFFRNQPVVRF